MQSRWIDVSIPLSNRVVHWPDDPEILIERISDIERGDTHTLSRCSMGTHTGTHVDAPAHFVRGGAGVDHMPAEAMVGTARVIEIHHGSCITTEELSTRDIRPGDILLFKTANSARCWWSEKFDPDFVYLSPEAAIFLASLHIMVVGIDYLSIGGFGTQGSEVHRILLEAGIWILEGLDLSGVEEGTYDYICMPLKILGADGAPARVMVRAQRQGRDW